MKGRKFKERTSGGRVGACVGHGWMDGLFIYLIVCLSVCLSIYLVSLRYPVGYGRVLWVNQWVVKAIQYTKRR